MKQTSKQHALHPPQLGCHVGDSAEVSGHVGARVVVDGLREREVCLHEGYDGVE